ncbi:hypothetical protein GCM10011504_52390 [Siccirubricoccus deserti]|uniref:DUF2161 domain-containing phosphodiesterase n=1 Tax=Siccirubricoccus deserti TaxID=2013562 RepID=A0A9X0R2V5_9PROT|nr:DUF2161 family putative PD-(D/E)XK-type phosphodiesterase [Siccirubricoccus deserti]MBC4018734.1 hypothetical protein [Siccirubricoccus deserti]GGC67941.1 hypothetical protein GCM10011504_52390 [Siccirubricoccus deserti]
MSRRSPETSLYAAVKAHLERLGYEAKGEVCGCDIVAVRPGEPPFLVITELKMGFTLELVLQGVDRLAAADEVWLAVRSSRCGRDRDRRVHRLCRLLGFGLLAVDPARHAVEVLAAPVAYRSRTNLKRRSLLLREHGRRQGDPTQGGASRTPIMTAYRQQALACAAALGEGPRRPRELKAIAPEAGRILLRNVYGWFERAERGVYRLSTSGRQALLHWTADPNDERIAISPAGVAA